VIGALITDLKERLPGVGAGDPLLLSADQFHREVARERIRATRRSFPFCVIAIELTHKERRRRRARRLLVRLLHRNLRMTDHKAVLGPGKYGVLLVDTPEMGGRLAMDRIAELAERHGLPVSVCLRVHDPEGFDPGDGPSNEGQRRRGDDPSARWIRVDGDVRVSSEDPLVPRPMLRMVAKRALDIVGAGVGLTVTGPIILAAMYAIRRHDSGPAIYKQTREGHRGKPFTIYKLRTMVVDAEKQQSALRDQSHRDGPAFKIANDPRVTPVGRFLRKTCIDELPQLWNVLKGDMSLVGPRPLPWHESRACSGWQRRRLEVRPGLTCDWQINKAHIKSFDDWMRLDLRYIDELGLFRDLRLIAKTFTVPMSGRGSE
jgi:lipopolysaccharide/colanic/teichoic acid biosynthesis glycosyltransferase